MNRLTFWRFFPKIFYTAFIFLTGSIVSAQIPTISSFTPTSGPIGTIVTITGTNFDTTPANNIVWFGAVQATVTTASATELKVTVPTGTTYQPVTMTVNGLTAFSSVPFTVTFPSTYHIDETSFASRIDFSTGIDPQDVVISDIDGDGKPDLIVTNANSNTISVFRNISASGSISSGSFAAKVNFDTYSTPVGISIGDIDCDGKPDLVIANVPSSSTVSVFRNTSTPGSITAGSFAARVDLATGNSSNDVAVSDIDGDGKPDLVVTNFNSNTISIFRNISTPGSITAGSFDTKVDFPSEMNLMNIAIADIDRDSKPDIVVPNYYSNTVSVYRNISTSGSITTGSFEAKVDFTTGTNPLGIALGDIDGDSKPDMIITNTNSNTVSIFRNISTTGSITTGSFDTRVDFATGSGPRGVAIGNVNGDDKPDLVIANYNGNTVSVFRNTSETGSITTSSFDAGVDLTTWTAPSIGAIGDIDGDGKADITVVNSNSNVISVLRNIVPVPSPPVITSFAPTSGPIGTTITITGANFNPTPANNIVWFGAVQATAATASATELTVTVPTGATYQPISVTDITLGLTAYSSSPFNVTFSSTRTIDATAFAAKVDFATGTYPYPSAIWDIDGDGKSDLIVANYSDNNISVYRNTSTSGSILTGSFADKVDFASGSNPYYIAIGELDGDGKPDLVVANYGSNTVSVFRNTSTTGSITAGSFATKVDFATGVNPQGIAIRDIDEDGKPDLIVVNFASNTVSVFRNTSSLGSINTGSFAASVDFTTGSYPNSVAVGDIDDDGKPDLAVLNYIDQTVSIFRNTSTSGSINSGTFAGKVDFTTGVLPSDIAIGDVDKDGKPDLVVSSFGNSVSVLRNTCTAGSIDTESFAAKIDFAVGGEASSVAVDDFDGDGKPDLAVVNYNSNSVSILRNISTSGSITAGSFAVKVDFATGVNPESIAIGDLDSDGKPDFVVANHISNTISVLRNTIPEPVPPVITSFAPTSGPIGTTVTITGTNFSSTAANNIVWFGAVQAMVTAATATQLTVTVPTGATYQPITITVNGLTAYSSAPFNVIFPSTQIIDASAFAFPTDFSVGPYPRSIAIGDIDGDGKADLAIVNGNNSTVSVFRNTSISGSISAGSFADKVDFNTGLSPNRVAIGDIDGDGKQDLVVINQNSNSISIYRNISTPGSITTGSLAAKVDFSAGNSPYYIAIGDIDGDGKPDLAVTNWAGNTVSVFRNTSTSGSITSDSFAAKVDFIVGDYPSGVVIGDIDGDGKVDLVVNVVSTNTISILRNTSTPGSITAGSFAAKVDFTTGNEPLGVAIGDFDGDGKPDLAVANSGSNTVSVYRNTSSPSSITLGSFDARVDFATRISPQCVAIGDIDGDSKPDLAITNFSDNTVSLFRNISTLGFIATNSFATRVDFTAGIDPSCVAIGDMDGDGRPDMVVTNWYDSTFSVLRNTIATHLPPTITSFTPVSGPVGTSVTISGSNFSTTAANNIVWFGAVQATITAATATQLTVTVPTGATYQPITVTVNGLTAYSSAPFSVTFLSSRMIDGTAFAPKVDFTAEGNPFFNAIGDIDGDGKTDLIVVNNFSNTISVYRNTSTSGSITSGSFAPKVDFSTGLSPNGIAIGDIDGDGKPDIAVTNYMSMSVSIFRNTSTTGSITTGSFAPKVDFITGSNPYGVAIGDIDADGKPDLAVADYTNNTVSVFRNTSIPGSITSGSFMTKVDFTTGVYPKSVALGDIDGDGKPDMAVTNYMSNSVSVFRNTSTYGYITSGSFASRIDLTTGTTPYDVAINDVDMDGKPDLEVVNYNSNMVSIYRNISTIGSIISDSFAPKVDFTTGMNPYSIAIGDFDGDGKPDLAVSNNSSNSISVFRNTSTSGSITTNSFAAKYDFLTASGPWGVAIGDIDGDGKPDLSFVNSGSNSVSVLRNTLPETAPVPPVINSFAPGSGPVGTTITISGINFSPTATNNIVWFGAVQAMVTAASETELTVTVPAGATYQPITETVNGLTAWSSAPFNVTFPGTGIIDATAFAPTVDFTAGTDPRGVAIGDINGDGKPDLVITNWNSNTISIFGNTSTVGSITASSFDARVDFTARSNPLSIAIGDIDGDGKPDLAVTNPGSSIVSIFRNMSNSGPITAGSFDARIDFTTGLNPRNVAIRDIDGDGKPELVVTNFQDNTFSVYRNTSIPGSISFAARIDFTTGIGPDGIAFGDIDRDGKPDLAVTNYQDNTVSIYRNTSSTGSISASSFAPKVNLTTGTNPGVIAIGDIDGDGKPDLTVANSSDNTVSIFRNSSSSGSITADSFGTKIDFATGTDLRDVAIGDINGDGKPDMVVTNNSSNRILVFRNNSISGSITSSSFATEIYFTTGTGLWAITIGDIDGDGKSDLAVVNSSGNTVSVLRNKISEPLPPVINSFTPTSGPIGTTVTITGSNFSTTSANNIVWFGAVQAAVTAASANELTVIVPAGATYQPVTVTVNGLTAYSSEPFSITFTSSDIINATSFATKVDFTSGAAPWSPAIVDIDGDSKPDLVVANENGNTISVYRNNSIIGSISAFSFTSKVDFTTGNEPHSVAFGDIDGDGKPDLVVANGDNTVSIFRNTGSLAGINSGSFASKVDFATGGNPISVTIGDIDGDGKPDLTVANWGSNTVSVFRNTSTPGSITTGSFAARVDFATGMNPSYAAIGDIDGDNKPDLVVANFNSSSVSIFRNTSTSGSIDSGSFSAKVEFTTGTNINCIALEDIDGDGKLDLVVLYSSIISIFRNISTLGSITEGSFDTKVDFTGGNYAYHFTIGNIDGDGKPDLAVADFSRNEISVLRNTSIPGALTSGSFAAIVNFTTGGGPTSIALGDLDGDGKSEMVTANRYDNTISVIRNTISATMPPTISSFTPASGPVGTTVTIEGTNFSTIPADNIVLFGTVQASVISATATQLMVIVPAGATTQLITVTVNGLSTFSVTSFTVTASPSDPPAISSFNPTSGTVGTIVTIDGSNFSTNISDNIVRFGTVQAAVISATATQLTVIVPAGATTQPIYVTADGLTANTSTSFIVIYAPVITSFNPNSGTAGSTVTINGANFSANSADNIVRFGEVQANVTAATTTQLTVTVPSGATTQTICVTVNGLTTCSGIQFIVTSSALQPVITSFNPTGGPVGTTVIITGSNFSSNGVDNIVRFGNMQADLFGATSTQLNVTVPNGATTNPISVTVSGLTGYSSMPFTVTTDQPPIIAGINPTSGPVGSTVTINGENFSQNPENNIVMFGDVLATVTGGNQNQITVLVPEGADGQSISVTVNGMTAYSGVTFTVTTPQDIELESSILTLNGDGINERLVFKDFGAFGKCSFYVYNSRGAVVFWNKDFMGEWDLTVNGRMIETGGYFYVIETELGTFRGSFSILRR